MRHQTRLQWSLLFLVDCGPVLRWLYFTSNPDLITIVNLIDLMYVSETYNGSFYESDKWWRSTFDDAFSVCQIKSARDEDKCNSYPPHNIARISNAVHWNTFRDQSAMLGEHLSHKKNLKPPYNPKIWLKMWPRKSKIVLPFLSKGRLNLLAKYSEPKKQIEKIFFPLGATRPYQ